MSWNRTTVALLLGAVIVLALVYGFWPDAITVETVVVEPGPFEVTVEEEARTRVTDRYIVTAPVTGHVRRIGLLEGDGVSGGEPLFVLEPHGSDLLDPRRKAEAEANLEAATAALAQARQVVRAAEAEASYATTEWQRIDALWHDDAATDRERERADAEARQSQARHASAERAVDVAMHRKSIAEAAVRVASGSRAAGGSERVVVRAPHDALLLRKYRESEGVVAAGEPILEIGDTSSLEVVAEVLSADAVRIRPGMRVHFERWGGGTEVTGTVRRVEPQAFTKVSALGVEEQRVRVVATAPDARADWKQLGDGYRVIARFVLSSAEEVLSIPSSALFRVDGEWAVFVVNNDRARMRRISVGDDAGLRVEVTGGLENGETVILHPDHTLRDGARVTIRNEGIDW
ncbi:MAG: HlyD family efflux transporter periplasmic adaptor subunit [Bacteroidetes bacterium]|jgi:HlyD family secretion protein|nr:HlyD family efflux transporter periplasmic adaptor subunit [Bacteroidota bacterium]